MYVLTNIKLQLHFVYKLDYVLYNMAWYDIVAVPLHLHLLLLLLLLLLLVTLVES